MYAAEHAEHATAETHANAAHALALTLTLILTQTFALTLALILTLFPHRNPTTASAMQANTRSMRSTPRMRRTPTRHTPWT